MKKVVLFLQLIISILLCCGLATGVQAKDINLGWSGQGSWTTLPYVGRSLRHVQGHPQHRRGAGNAFQRLRRTALSQLG